MCGTPARPTSPAGGSILVTWAPRSRSALVQLGPDSTRVKSTTRNPSNGAGMSVPLEDGRAGPGSRERGEAARLVVAAPHRHVERFLPRIGRSNTAACREIGSSLDAVQ